MNLYSPKNSHETSAKRDTESQTQRETGTSMHSQSGSEFVRQIVVAV